MYKPVCIWRCRSLLATLSPLWPNVPLPNHRQIPTLCLRTRQTQPVKKCVPCRPSHPSSLCDLLGNERRWLLTKGRCGCKSPWITKAGEAFCCGGVDVEVCQRMRRDTEDSRWIAGIRMVGLHVWKKWQEVKETRRWWGDAADNCQWRERGHTVKLWQLPLRLWELRLQRGRLRFVSQKKNMILKMRPIWEISNWGLWIIWCEIFSLTLIGCVARPGRGSYSCQVARLTRGSSLWKEAAGPADSWVNVKRHQLQLSWNKIFILRLPSLGEAGCTLGMQHPIK